MIFSPNGNYLALSTVENSIILLDSFDGKIKNKFSNYINEVFFNILRDLQFN